MGWWENSLAGNTGFPIEPCWLLGTVPSVRYAMARSRPSFSHKASTWKQDEAELAALTNMYMFISNIIL